MIENVARALAQSHGLNFDEVCGVDADPDNGYCDSGTCIASGYEDHDATYARAMYRADARAAIAAMTVQAEPVAWRYERTDGFVILVSKRYTDQHPKGDGWTEQALYAIPTPPAAGGSDAE